ncbi:MAG: DUF6356 family protein [Gammaproteobacteria bacterium]
MSRHLKEVNESYFEHMLYATKYGIKMIFAGLTCIIHGLFPDIFVTTASQTMESIKNEINERKQKANTAE